MKKSFHEHIGSNNGSKNILSLDGSCISQPNDIQKSFALQGSIPLAEKHFKIGYPSIK